jgi:threonine synthase
LGSRVASGGAMFYNSFEMSETKSYLDHLECPECHRSFAPDTVQTICAECGSPLLARYNLAAVRKLDRKVFLGRPETLWRWREVLPVREAKHIATLGEGGTPLLPAPRLGGRLGLTRLEIKDEGLNPTGTFKSRGLGVAVSKAMELGVKGFVVPTAGNAGGALAAYAARAGVKAHVFMPRDAPAANQSEVRLLGAELHLVDGLISDAGRESTRFGREAGLFDVSTLKEPYRLEGKKTMGYEIAVDGGWVLPDVILYPTGGGTGLIGIWKAFEEMEEMGWIGPDRPRMVAVQAEGCAPVVRAFEQGRPDCEFFSGARTIAAGLRVPKPFADRLILRVVRESGGTAVRVRDEEMIEARSLIASSEGLLACLEGSATVAALPKLLASGWIEPHERVVCLNTGTALKDPL